MRNYITALTVISFIICLPFLLYSQQTDDLDKLIDQGIQYERQNKLDQAIEVYRRALESDRTNLLVKVRLAKVLSWKNEFDEALELLDEVLQEENLHSEALFRKAQIVSWQGKYKEAIATYELYLMKEKNDSDGLLGIARVSFWAGENERAINYFNDAIRAGADEVDARIDLGKVYLAMNEIDKAKVELNTVLSIDPENSEAIRLLQGIHTQKAVAIQIMGLSWSIYEDNNIGITQSNALYYHFIQHWDLYIYNENFVINGDQDVNIDLTTVYRGFSNLYLIGGFSFKPYTDLTQTAGTLVGAHYSFKDLFTAGMDFEIDFYKDETLFTIRPEFEKYFGDISYILLRYNQYIFSTGYLAANVGLHLNLNYYSDNSAFADFSYGGDVEVKDRDRRVFELALGISYNFTENFEITLSYGWLESEYGRTHKVAFYPLVKW